MGTYLTIAGIVELLSFLLMGVLISSFLTVSHRRDDLLQSLGSKPYIYRFRQRLVIGFYILLTCALAGALFWFPFTL
ncbi:hypothetical protein COU76_03290 [Candidatus Peregrinibacteria bacterium CG10_big_fil_rev_8_21_14_0_10_49_10]|nr:MAG: hypothetical protein COU76_03290 [Candidatus Peregrinibacteria bacterium CG10_big_fil_rev_8_21_14_0_10_49_10]